MSRFDRRRSGAILMIAVGVLAVYAGFLLHAASIESAGPKPPPPGGGGNSGRNGGGSGGGGGSGQGGTADTLAPTTSISIVGHGYVFVRSGIQYYSGNATVTLNATDDRKVASIYLQDNGSMLTLALLQWSHNDRSAWTTTTITAGGLHLLEYYSVDNSSNTEPAHVASVGIGKPGLSDLYNLITDSGVDNSGILNALLAKVRSAEGEQARGQPMNSLNALVNQLNALEGKHGLDSGTVARIEALIQQIANG